MRRSWSAVLLFVTAAGTAVTAGAAGTPEPTPTIIAIHDFEYRPAALTVARGTAVRWVNRDEETHTVTSATGAFTSRGLERDDVFEQAFTKPGTYRYFCSLHPKMTATIVVR